MAERTRIGKGPCRRQVTQLCVGRNLRLAREPELDQAVRASAADRRTRTANWFARRVGVPDLDASDGYSTILDNDRNAALVNGASWRSGPWPVPTTS